LHAVFEAGVIGVDKHFPLPVVQLRENLMFPGWWLNSALGYP
jgi:hypothetical protein